MKQKILVAINNYNYCDYVCEAIESALSQTVTPDQVIVIDDGSTDDSVAVIRKNFGDRVYLVAKKNEGQLSCFNEVMKFISPKDIVFFLDADDHYKSNHIESYLEIYAAKPDIDYIYSDHEFFGPNVDDKLNQVKHEPKHYGFTVFPALYYYSWIGGPTSTLSIRGSLLARFMPYRNVADWKVMADDILVIGSSLAGGRKYFTGQKTVEYRVHDTNNFFGKQPSFISKYKHRLAQGRMVSDLARNLGFPYQNEISLLCDEYSQDPDQRPFGLKGYTQLILVSNWCLYFKVLGILTLFKTAISGSSKAR